MTVNVKIYKTATQKSIMDVLSALDYHKENKNKELVYKGNIVFLINEYGASKKNERAYLSKTGAKVLTHSMIFGKFQENFPNGFSEYGGSTKNGQVIARVFSIQMTQRKQYVFTIEVGPGVKEGNGAIKKIKTDTKVQTYVSFEEAMKLAHEVYDFIQQSEVIALMNKKPLFTILPEFKTANDSNGDGNLEDVVVHIEEDSQLNDEKNSPEEPYIIKIGNWKGTSITALDSNVLKAVVEKIKPDNEDKIEFVSEAMKELARRPLET